MHATDEGANKRKREKEGGRVDRGGGWRSSTWWENTPSFPSSDNVFGEVRKSPSLDLELNALEAPFITMWSSGFRV